MAERGLGAGLGLHTVTDHWVLSLRHRADDEDAVAQALLRAGLAWPGTGRFAALAKGGWMLRLSPRHSLAVGCDRAILATAIERLAPGRHPSLMAIDTTEGQRILELRGPGIEALLHRVMEAGAPQPGLPVMGGARVADVPVVLVPHAAQACSLVVEAPLEDHLRARLQVAAAHRGL